MKKIDIILAGGGCAGLMIANALIDQGYKGVVVIIDKDEKKLNDRTWSFWEKTKNPLHPIIYNKWQYGWFHGKNFNERMSFKPYEYKMIRGIDFYNYIKEKISNAPNFDWIKDSITGLETDEDRNIGIVKTLDENFEAPIVFNSIQSWKDFDVPKSKHTLLQHFKGWIIETDKPVFDAEAMTYMDLRISDTKDVIFMYILPFSKNRGLVEYTLFDKKVLNSKAYDKVLKSYIQDQLGIASSQYKITEEEYGVIPMSNFKFPDKIGSAIYNVGSAGGNVKPTTGYTFLRLQKMVPQIIKNIVSNKDPFDSINKSIFRFELYDSTLLHVLSNNTYSGPEFFTTLFKKKGAPKMFKFLDEETNLLEEIDIMSAGPKVPFTKAFFKELLTYLTSN